MKETCTDDSQDEFEEVELTLPDNYETLSPMEKAQAMKAAKKEAGHSQERINPMEKARLKPTPNELPES